MPTAADVLNVARSRLESDGHEETAWYGLAPGTEWCAIFVSYVLFHAGFTSLAGETTARGFAYVPYMETAAKDTGLWRPPPLPPLPGWSIVYDWNGDQLADHVGLVEYVDPGTGTIHTIEGNAPDPVTREIEVERHVVGLFGDRSYSTVLGYIAWPFSATEAVVPVLAAQHNPPVQFVTGAVAHDFARQGIGVRFLTDDGHVYEFGMPHVGSPAEDPAANWAAGGRHGAKIVNNAAGGFTCWDTRGESYSYGPQ